MAEQPSSLDETAQDSAPERILVVEDVTMTRRMLTRRLERDGFEVLEAQDGQEALSIVTVAPVDAIITDVQMPRKSGIQLLEELRAKGISVPVILITSTPTVEAAVECMKIGAYDYISKPVDLDELSAKIVEAMEQTRQADRGVATPTAKGNQLGDYRVVRLLGEGSMGAVCLVEKEQQGVTSQYALKILKVGGLGAEQSRRMRRRFLHEAQAAAKVAHPHVVRFVEYGLAREEGIPFIVMEYFPHPTLREILASGAHLDYEQKIQIVKQVASALAAIHEQGICHRDIKPGNIMVDTDRRQAKLTDFGVARLPESDLTLDTHIVGSPAYMAPEAFTTSHVDERADIFSLGIVTYELCLGVRPFGGESSETIAVQISTQRPRAPRRLDPSFPPALESVLARMLKKHPEDRYARAAEVEGALETCLHELAHPSQQRRGVQALLSLLPHDWS